MLLYLGILLRKKMKSIHIKNVTKSYNGEVVLDRLNLTIPLGKFFALLGPSGSGKTTLLRLIAGFEKVDSGNIYLGDEDITNKPINQRRVNTVFQDYALFTTMNVYENVAYSQVIKGLPADQIEEKVYKILKAVSLQSRMYKSIDQLSGGEQQRVALARAIINEPEVLLLDEPLSALDVNLRVRVLVELIDLQDKLQTTFVYVTHDPSEALAVADQMAIMNYQGEIEQIGTNREIYEFPVSTFVAKSVGPANIIQGTLRILGSDMVVDVDKLGSYKVDGAQNKPWMVDGASVFMSLRPEKVLISKKPKEGFSNVMRGIVESIVYYGRSTQYNVRLKNNGKLQVFEQNDEHFLQEVIDYDNEVYLYWQKENVVLLQR